MNGIKKWITAGINAVKAVLGIDYKHLDEVRSYRTPPTTVAVVVASVTGS